MLLCKKGDLANAKYLVDYVDIDIHDKNDLAFYLACVNGHLHVAYWLYSFGGIDIHYDNNLFFRNSCSLGKLDVAQWLYSLGGIDLSNSEVRNAVIRSVNDYVCEWFFLLKCIRQKFFYLLDRIYTVF